MTNVTASIIMVSNRGGVVSMDLLLEKFMNTLSEEPCDENTPKVEKEENNENPEYDYYKRLWF
jgi:hypothetical protein